MNNKQQHPGMANEGVPIMSRNPIIDEAEARIFKDAQPATDYTEQPTINPQPMRPDEWVEGGTVLSDTTFSYGTSGVVERDNLASVNSTKDWEAIVREAERQRIAGRTVFNTPPSSSGAPSLPTEADGNRPNEERLAQVRKRDRLVNLNCRLKTLQVDEQRTALKLKGIKEALANLKAEFESM